MNVQLEELSRQLAALGSHGGGTHDIARTRSAPTRRS